MSFCKVYESEQYGQLLFKLDQHVDDGTPEVRFYAQPPDLGVCSISAGYEDTDEGWDKAEEFFKLISEDIALKWAEQMFHMMETPEEA